MHNPRHYAKQLLRSLKRVIPPGYTSSGSNWEHEKRMLLPNKLLTIKLLILGLAALIAVYGFSEHKARAFVSGPPAGYTNAPGEANCTSCHSSFELDSGPGAVRITGVPVQYSSGQQVAVTVSVSQAGGDRLRNGFQLTAIDDSGRQAGTIVVTSPDETQLSSGTIGGNPRTYIQHTFLGSVTPEPFDQRVWTFTWVAPDTSVGAVTFYATGNAGDGAGTTEDDYIYSTSIRTVPMGPSDPNANLSITNTATPNPVAAGSNITHTITVTNNGPAPAVNVIMVDDPSPQTTFQSLSAPADWSCDTPPVGTTRYVFCTAPGLAAGASASFTLVVNVNGGVPGGTQITHGAYTISDTPDPDFNNNVAIATVTVSSGIPTIQLEPVLTGLTLPVYVTNARDGSNRLFILERLGVIKVLQPGATTPTVFLDITDRVLSTTAQGNEQGLLGLTFHPQYATNGRFFVHYTVRGLTNTNRIAEYRVSADPNVADRNSEAILMTIPQPFSNHNGGMIEFGPDGYLYIAKGDGGSGFDPGNRAQNINELLGKILRIDVSTPGVYTSPPDNPYCCEGVPGRDEIFALGLRNPWRFSFDRVAGYLLAGDVGQNQREEIDYVTRGGNYGWRVFEGTLCTGVDPGLCFPENYIPPIYEYSLPGTGRCAITGGYTYRGAIGTLPTSYIFGDYCTGEIYMLREDWSVVRLLDTTLFISSFGEDEAGEIYVVGLTGGTIHRIVRMGAAPEQTKTK